MYTAKNSMHIKLAIAYNRPVDYAHIHIRIICGTLLYVIKNTSRFAANRNNSEIVLSLECNNFAHVFYIS